LAQSTCAHDGVPFARFWLHNGFLSIDHEKMSKSLGNVLLVHDLIRHTPGEVIRLALLSAHYRQPLEWSGETIDAAQRMLDRLYGAVRGVVVSDAVRAAAEPPAAFLEALEDDLNSPKAMAEFFALAKALNKASDPAAREELAAAMFASGELIGLLREDPAAWFAGHGSLDIETDEIEALLERRRAAKGRRDFAGADAIREELSTKGVRIEDGPNGTTWRRG
jgi:cysteinyl-tRNA synthetase